MFLYFIKNMGSCIRQVTAIITCFLNSYLQIRGEEVEDEQHFLKECWMYEDLREEAMMGVVGLQFQELSLEKLLGKGNRQDIERVVVYIRRAQGRRRRILEMREGG